MDFEIRKQKIQGRKKLRREREEYFRLMRLGFSNADACERVGVNPRTG
nr:hypothetical protein [Streptomyces niphimycinicus]